MESADRESRRLDILSVKKEANLSAREVGEVEVGKGDGDSSRPGNSLFLVLASKRCIPIDNILVIDVENPV